MKIVINTCHGGFGLSDKVMLALEEKGIVELIRSDSSFCPLMLDVLVEDTIEFRSHPELVKLVEEMGEDAWGPFAQLAIIDVPDGIDVYIDKYDGWEEISEKHRRWGLRYLTKEGLVEFIEARIPDNSSIEVENETLTSIDDYSLYGEANRSVIIPNHYITGEITIKYRYKVDIDENETPLIEKYKELKEEWDNA